MLEQGPCEVEAAKLQQAYNKGFEDCKQVVLDNLSELNAISFYEAQEDSKEAYYEIRQAIKNMTLVNPQKTCDTCRHSDETDGSHCYECVKGMKDNYDSQENGKLLDKVKA